MHGWHPLLTAISGFAATIGLALGFELLDARPPTLTVPQTAQPSRLKIGDSIPGHVDEVFPLERYVIEGESQWLPLLLQWDNPAFENRGKRGCIAKLASMAEDATCPVEYAYWIDARAVRGVEAMVPSGDSVCAAYVECRLPGLLGTSLDVPPSELVAHPSGLRIVDKVQHAAHSPTATDLEREIDELETTLAQYDEPETTAPAAAKRLQDYLGRTQAQRLEFLRRRGAGP